MRAEGAAKFFSTRFATKNARKRRCNFFLDAFATNFQDENVQGSAKRVILVCRTGVIPTATQGDSIESIHLNSSEGIRLRAKEGIRLNSSEGIRLNSSEGIRLGSSEGIRLSSKNGICLNQINRQNSN